MAQKIYMWIEDRKEKSGYVFWKALMDSLFPDIIVESKKNNSELVKAVNALSGKETDMYIVAYDNSFDNLYLYQEQKRLKQAVAIKKNVKLLDIICFEYILLEFDRLIEWIYAPEDEFRVKRAGTISARNSLIKALKAGNMDYKLLREVVEYDRSLVSHNIEQLAAKLLFDLTRNTGFEVSKGKLGECWIQSCCEWENRQTNDLCGLEQQLLSKEEKMKSIFQGTSLCEKFFKIGLEVPVC